MQLFSTLPFRSVALGCFTRIGRASAGLSSVGMWTSALTSDNVTVAYLLSAGMLFKDLTLPVSFAVCVDIGKSRAGTVSGTMNMIGQLGGFFLAIFFGKIVDWAGDYNYPLYVIGTLPGMSSSLWLVIDPAKELTWKVAGANDPGLLDG